MSEMDLSTQQELVGYVLGRLDDAERLTFEARLQKSPELAAQVTRLRRQLAPLAAWQVDEPASDMADRVMARVATTSPLKYVAERAALPPDKQSAGASRRRFGSLNELVAMAACLAILVGIFFPGLTGIRDRSRQLRCATNVASFGGGILQYMNQSGGQLPFTGAAQPVNWVVRPNRTNLAPGIQIRIIVPTQMVCPTSPVRLPDDSLALRDLPNYLQRVDIPFYSTQLINGSRSGAALTPDMPFAADPNPMFENGAFVPANDVMANSRAHDRKGQNTFFLDGSVRFLKRPLVGNASDNIWRAEDVDTYTGTETPSMATDAFLIP